MAFRHRKLLKESADDFSDSCEDYCAAVENPSGICPLKCIDSCPSLCKLPTLEIPQPPPTPPPAKYHRLSLLLTASLAALAASFFLFTCYTIYRIYTNWCAPCRRIQRRHPERDGVGPEILPDDGRGPPVDHHIWYIQTVGLHPSVIGAITIVRYKKGEGLIDGSDCSVCLNEFQEDETLRLLPKCSHAFHVPCIDTWLRSHTNCPLCRAGIVADPAIQAQNSHIPGPGPEEETRLGLSGRISRRVTDVLGSESESSELEIGIIVSGDEMVSEDLNGPKAVVDGPMRRSVSVNSLSVMDKNLICPMFVESIKSECRIVGVNRGMLRLVETQTGSSFMKRSVSCGGNVFLSRLAASLGMGDISILRD